MAVTNVISDVRRVNSRAYEIAKVLADKRRRNGTSRKQLNAIFGTEVGPYLTMYECFERLPNGNYVYRGTKL